MKQTTFYKNAPREKEGAPCVSKGAPSNDGLFCRRDRRNCESCGFNPLVAASRIDRILERLKTPEEKKKRRARTPIWSSEYADVKASCPYYLGVDRKNRYIFCTGAITRTELLTKFKRQKDFDEYVARTCKGPSHIRCRLYRLLNGNEPGRG